MSELDLLLMNIELCASFKNLDSNIKLSGEQCKLLIDYIKELKEVKK
jgi:hypothetical protein